MAEEEKRTFTGMVARIRNQVVTEYIKTEAIVNLLLEKGIITQEEFDEKFDTLWDEKSEKVFEYIQMEDIKE